MGNTDPFLSIKSTTLEVHDTRISLSKTLGERRRLLQKVCSACPKEQICAVHDNWFSSRLGPEKKTSIRHHRVQNKLYSTTRVCSDPQRWKQVVIFESCCSAVTYLNALNVEVGKNNVGKLHQSNIENHARLLHITLLTEREVRRWLFKKSKNLTLRIELVGGLDYLHLNANSFFLSPLTMTILVKFYAIFHLKPWVTLIVDLEAFTGQF